MKNRLFPDDVDMSMGKAALLHLMQDYFRFADALADHLRTYNEAELTTFLVIRHAQQETVDVLDKGRLDEYRDVLEQHPDIKDALEIQ